MDDCEIDFEDTVGIVKPKTYGGFNGDVSRKYFRREIDVERDFVSAWHSMVRRIRKERNVTLGRRYNDTKGRSGGSWKKGTYQNNTGGTRRQSLYGQGTTGHDGTIPIGNSSSHQTIPKQGSDSKTKVPGSLSLL